MKKFFLLIPFLAIFSLQAKENVTMYELPSCKCCEKWASIMQDNDFNVEIVKISDKEMLELFEKHKVPLQLASCHLAVVGDYVVEGHVPPQEIKRMLKTKPNIIGIAVPGMPFGSYGMEEDGQKDEIYDVISFDQNLTYDAFATYEGHKKLK